MRLSTIIGAINLSLIAFFRFDLVGAILQTIYRKMEKDSNSHPEEN